ncbi:probable serine/threonine-protein kinase pats1 isoform X2 [Amphiura filiformis]|uniref:probable serine/threonine-protein kinase pats1 isoform X2 n=1 Tax=Amphiura filiformis TaxID=82378 RepID=UPI003B219BE6
MHFHPGCHGNNITFTNNNAVATRTKSYYHGITFSEKPHNLGELVTFLLVEENTSWTGTIRFGLTNNNPDEIDSLPPFSIPDFSSKSGTWMKQLSEQHNNVGSKIGLVFSNDGSMSLFVDGECVETCDLCGAVDVSEPVWIVIDVYGTVTSVRLIPTEADTIPVEIISHSIEAKQAYQQAFSFGTKNVFRTRLMIVGQERVGKTSLKKTLTRKRFQRDQEMTDGIDTSTVCTIASGDTWKTCRRDCGGDNQVQTEYIQAVADYMVKKLTIQDDDEDTDEDAATNIPADIQAASESLDADDSEDLMVPERVTEEVERCLREQRQVGQNLPTAKREKMLARDKEESKINLAIWDFGGHSLYRATHQAFLSSRAVYIVVFNLSHDLNQDVTSKIQTDKASKAQTIEQGFTSLEHLDFWLRSIFTYTTPNQPKDKMLKQLSPPIFIVGTHRDALDTNPQTRQKMVEEKFAQIRQHLKNKDYRQHVVNPFYALENSLDDSQNEEALSLRKHLYSVLMEEPYMGDAVPIRWLLFEDAVKKSVEKGIHFMTLEQTKQLTHSLGMESDQDLFALLHFYHELGHIIYFGGEEDGDHQGLRDIVILDPRWLIDVFRRVITVKDVKEQWPIYMDAWTRLDNEGILEDRLIEHMWSHHIDLKPALTELMIKFDLIYPLTQDQDATKAGDICYYVPSLMKPGDHHHHVTPSESDSATVFYIDFDGFLPDGIFHRLLARAVSWSQAQGGSMPSLHYRHAILYADDLHQLELVMSTSHHAKITVIITRVAVVQTAVNNSQDKEDNSPSPSTCSKVKDFMSATLKVLQQTYPKPIRYSFHIDCPCNTGVPHTINLEQCLTKDIFMCSGRSRIDTTGIKKQFQCAEGKPTSLRDSGTTSLRDSGDPSSIASSIDSSSFSSVESENKIATVSQSDLKIIGKLGHGGFGLVFHAKHKHWDDVAVKQLNFSEGVLAEAKQMWRTISSTFLVRIMGIIDDPNHPSIVMEYFKHGSLKVFMKYMTNIDTLPRRVKMIFDITMGMNYLHTLPSPIVHRDLKCDNIFVGEGFKAKIGDLGLAVNTASVKTRLAAEKAGTISHIPPEAWAGTITKPTTQWDVYSFGITLYEILTNGKDPWPQLHTFANDALLSVWLSKGHRPNLDAIPDTMPEDLINIMRKCWDGEPTKRPSFQVLKMQLSKMYATKYEDNENKADKLIMDEISKQKHHTVQGTDSDDQTGVIQGTDEW